MGVFLLGSLHVTTPACLVPPRRTSFRYINPIHYNTIEHDGSVIAAAQAAAQAATAAAPAAKAPPRQALL